MRIKITPILPKKVMASPDEVSAAIEAALDELAEETKTLYEKTVRTWNEPPTFTIRTTKYGRSIGTRSKIYSFVDAGTKPHKIRPRGNYPLRFAAGGRPKTKPRVISSYAGAPGDSPRASYEVNHPGTEPRGFTGIIQERIQKKFKATMKRHLEEAFRR